MKRPKFPIKRDSTIATMLFSMLMSFMVIAGTLTVCIYMLMTFMGFLVNPFYRILAMPLFMIVFITMFAASTGRGQLKPINDLVHAMHEVSQGDFSVRVEEQDVRGEMGELVRSFNDMAQDLGGLEMFRKDFINNFSHEFKTPIVSIRGFAKQLQRDDLTEEQRREYLDIIVSESDRLAHMANNVLLLTKLENQTIMSDKTVYRLDEQLRSCILLLEKQWTEKNIDLDPDLDEVEIKNNEETVAHIWVNLIGNAIKFSPDGAALHIRLRGDGNDCVTEIEDEGEGMDEHTRSRIFEKFYQGDSAHSTEGNGLGLALVKRIVDLCNGTIEVKSTLGKGTTFTVRLPKGIE